MRSFSICETACGSLTTAGEPAACQVSLLQVFQVKGQGSPTAFAMSPLQAWLSCTSRAEEAVAHALGRGAKACARNPWKCITVTVVGCLLCAVGVVRFSAVNQARDLWVDQNSQVMKDLVWTENYFTFSGRVNRVLVTAKDGGNVLRMDTMTELFHLADDVKALVDENGKNFSNLCIEIPTGCLNNGMPRYFGRGISADFNSTVQSQADILTAVNKAASESRTERIAMRVGPPSSRTGSQ